MESGDRLVLVVSGLLVLLSGVVVMAESALVSVSRVRALAWADEERRGAAPLARLLEAPERPLAVVALLRMAARVAAATMVGIVGWRQGGGLGALLAVTGLLTLVLLVGELAPRRLSRRFGDVLARRSAGTMLALVRLGPIAALASLVVSPPTGSRARNGNGASEETAPIESEDEDELDREEEQLIHSIFEFGDTVVREVMVPRTDMVAVPSDATVDDALDVAIPAGYSRLPVYRDHLDDLIGLVFVKDLIRATRRGRGDASLSEVLRKAVFVPEQKRAAELLREMQTRKFHMAIAVDEYGGTAGLVTLEDVLEEIVGEIVDEYDVEEPTVEEIGDGLLRVAGRTPIAEVSSLLGVDLPDEEWDTVGGLMFDLVGHVPSEGESVSFQGIDFVAERVQGRRIVSVTIRGEGDEHRRVDAGA